MKKKDDNIAMIRKQQSDEMAKIGQQDYEAKQQALEAKKLHLEEQRDKLEKEGQRSREKRTAIIAESDADRHIERDIQAEREVVNGNLQRVIGTIRNLNQQMSNSDASARYGQNIQAVRDEIARAQWHHSPPIGPLGTCVKLKPGEESYREVLDSLLGSLLNSWAVKDSRDKGTLQAIFKKCVQNRGTLV